MKQSKSKSRTDGGPRSGTGLHQLLRRLLPTLFGQSAGDKAFPKGLKTVAVRLRRSSGLWETPYRRPIDQRESGEVGARVGGGRFRILDLRPCGTWIWIASFRKASARATGRKPCRC